MHRIFGPLALSLVLSALVGTNASAQLIDNFNQVGLPEYTYTPILEATAAAASTINNNFSDASGALVVAQTGTNGTEQGVFLRNDFSLSVGQTLTIDAAFATQASQMDFGLAVSATKTPTAANATTTDTRTTFQFAAVAIRPSQDAVRVISYNGTSLVSGTGILAATETTVSKLFIERNSSTVFTLGYIDITGTRFNNTSVTFSDPTVGVALGFYADLRANTDTLGSFDNLQIVPEPSTVAMLTGGCAMLALAGLRRRRVV
jgi:hypothetical protein